MDYSFSLSVNGVENSGNAFSVRLIPADPVDVALNWLSSAVAGIFGVILLITNVMKHHWVSEPCCFFLFVLVRAE